MHKTWPVLLYCIVWTVATPGCLFVQDAGLGFDSAKTGQVSVPPDAQVADTPGTAGKTAEQDASAAVPDAAEPAPADVARKPGWNTMEPKVFSQPGIRIEVPAQSLFVPLELTMVPASDLPSGCVGQAWQLGPEGTEFAKPVRVVMQVPDSAPIATLKMATLVNGKWQPLTISGIDSANHEVWGETLHFSPYCAVAASPTPTDGGACPGAVQQPDGTCTCELDWSGVVTDTESYAYCKAILVEGFGNCVGYDAFKKYAPCCVKHFEAIGGPSATGHSYFMPATCDASANCKVGTADPWAWLVKCGALP